MTSRRANQAGLIGRATGVCGIAMLLLAGCAFHLRPAPAQARVWSGLGISFILPAGDWKTESVGKGKGVLFHNAAGWNVLLLRLPAEKDEPAWVSLKDLFIQFREKKEVGRWTAPLADGRMASGVDYEVEAAERTLRLRAAVVRNGEWVYDLVEWGDSRPRLESLLAGMTFAPAGPEGKGR